MKDSKQVTRSHAGQLAGSARKREKRKARQQRDQELRAAGIDPVQIRKEKQQELDKLASATQASLRRFPAPTKQQRTYDSWY